MRSIPVLAAIVLIALTAVPQAQAKTCKDTVTAKARSAAQVSDESRVRRARDKAISNWSARARDTYGWAYRFWRRSDERHIECGGVGNAKVCTASARPCRLL
jgi:hypothetical protein